MRKNLEAAARASDKLLAQVDKLDGNSLQLLRGIMGGGSIRSASSELRRCLHQAYETAVATFPLSGRRPEHERDCLAALLRDALEVHTSAKVTATQSSIFENLLCFVFELLDEPHQNLHTLAERVLKRKLVSRPSAGVLMIDKIKIRQKIAPILRDEDAISLSYWPLMHANVPEETDGDLRSYQP